MKAESGETPEGAFLRTLLVSDLVGSTRLVERLGDQRAFELFGRHDRLARDLLRQHGGREIDKTDGFLHLFERPLDAVHYAVAYHAALAALTVETGVEVTSRVGIHFGEVYLRENLPEDVTRGAKPLEVEGLAKPMAARLMSVAVGGQTLLTRGAFDLARRAHVGDQLDAGLQWIAHGAYRFKGVDEPVDVFEAGVDGVAPLAPPPDSEKVTRVAGDETVVGWRPGPGQRVPRRPHWELVHKLGEGGFGEVWLARHVKTGDQLVFKFCFDHERLRGLQREVTLFRLLKEALGSRDDIARILDWSFDEAPYFVESEYTEGGSLIDWEREHGGLDELDRPQRLELIAQVAEALGAAHSVGILHKDLKPANVLVYETRAGELAARLTDFGIGMVTDHSRLSDAGITMLGFTQTQLPEETSLSGTQLYLAPELIEGKLPTVQADIYALGVMLFQLVVGDLKRALAPGWERDIDDELLREDIAVLVDGSPDRRLSDPAEAARRLRQLEQRRADRAAEEQARADAEAAQLALERGRRRRRLLTAVAVIVTVFAVAMGVQSWKIKQERDRAERNAELAAQEAETARQVRDFLVELFRGADPKRTGGRQVTARELLDRGAEQMQDELMDQPVHRSRLLRALATLYFKVGEYSRAEELFSEALAIQESHSSEVDPEVATELMNLGNVYLNQGRLEEGQTLLERALTIIQQTRQPDEVQAAKILSNLGSLEYFRGDDEAAARLWRQALGMFEDAGVQDHREPVVALLSNLARAEIALGRLAGAESSLLSAQGLIEGADEPNLPALAQVEAGLGEIDQLRGDLEEAEAHLVRCLELREQVLGPDHPLVGVALSELGELKTRSGDADDARELIERSLVLHEKAFGADSPRTAQVHLELARVDRVQGRLGSAEARLDDVMAVLESDQPGATLAAALTELALIRQETGALEPAQALLERALSIYETGSGALPEVAEAAEHLAEVYQRLGMTDRSRGALERALEARRQLLGEDHPSVTDLERRLTELSDGG